MRRSQPKRPPRKRSEARPEFFRAGEVARGIAAGPLASFARAVRNVAVDAAGGPSTISLVRLVHNLRMARVYSTYEAKAKLSEILKKVRAGQRVGISYRGELVAEVAPIQPVRETFEKRLKRLEAQGVIVPAKHPGKPFPRIVCRPGALKRFLASRD